MSETIDKITGFLGDTFGNSTTGIKWGGVASVAGGVIGGFLLGDVLGATIGLVAGTLLGGVVNNLVSGILPGSGKDKAPEGIAPRIQKGATQDLDLAIDGKVFKLALPKVSELKRPWAGESSDSFIHKMGEDTLRIIQNPEKKTQSVDLLLKTVKERNQPFYDYLATVQKYHTDFENYNKDTRPAIMKHLGIDGKDVSNAIFAPPEYRDKLKLEITSEKELGLDTRAHLNISEGEWNKLDAVAKLSRIEESMNKRMLEVSGKQAKLKTEMEEQDRKVPFDLDFSGNALVNRLNWATFEIFGDTAETRIDTAMKNFYEGKAEHKKSIGGKTYVVRDEKAAEDEFRNEMDAIITEYIAKGNRGGEVAAKQYREMISIMIDERKVRMQWNGIKLTKQMWADEAERWTKDAEAFSTELTTYASTYANGAGANKNYAVVREFAIPLMGNNDAEKKAARIKAEKVESVRQANKASDGVHLLLETINVSEDSPKTLFALMPVDIERSVKTLPTHNDVSGNNLDVAPTDPAEKKYYDAAKRLSSVLGVKVNVSILKDDKGIPNFELELNREDDAKFVQDKLAEIRNAAGLKKEDMAVGREYRKVTINASSLMTLAEAEVELKGEGITSGLKVKKLQPTGMNEDAFKKLEAKQADLHAATKGRQTDPYLRDSLEKAAANYNAKLAAFKANNKDNRVIAELKVAHVHLAEESVSYLKGVADTSERYNKIRDEELAKLAKDSGKGTKLDGSEGFRVFIVDKRGGKNQKIALDGIKKDGKYTVTGWSRMTADDKMGEVHWFGKDMVDVAAGIGFDPKAMTGLDAIMQKVDADPSSKTVADVTPVRTAADVAPEKKTEPVAATATPNVLDQALASVSFKPLADAANNYVLPMVKDLMKKGVAPAAA